MCFENVIPRAKIDGNGEIPQADGSGTTNKAFWWQKLQYFGVQGKGGWVQNHKRENYQKPL